VDTKNWVALGRCPFGMGIGGVSDPENTPLLHMCNRVAFGRTTSKGIGRSRGNPWPRTNTPLHTWVTVSNLTAVGQTYERTYEDPPEKWCPCVPPFKVTQVHRNWRVSIGLPLTSC